jgi:hypothetical protein
LGGTSIYRQQAPDNAALPYVVFSYPSIRDDNITPHATTNNVVLVMGYAATPGAADNINAAAGSLLHMGSITVTGATVFWMAREDTFVFSNTDASGRRVYQTGAHYRVRLQE